MEDGIIVLGLLLVAGLLYFIVRRYGWLGTLVLFGLIAIRVFFGWWPTLIALVVYYLIRYLVVSRQ